ncbi:MAG: hypothetical protein WBQ64_11145 [Terriglobales bacterium]
MAIDDPKAAFVQQYMQEEQESPLAHMVMAGKLAFPKAALPLEIFRKVADRFTRASVKERLEAMWNLLVMETEHLETTKASPEDIQEAIQLALRRDAEEFDDNKRERYVKLIGNAFRSEEQIQDVATFVQTIEQLNERDVIVLKVMNKIMNKESDWKPQQDPVVGGIAKLHPSTLIGRAQELSLQIAMALGQKVETNLYTREEGYGICTRLQGFGLAHELEQTRELPLANYCFRLSVLGIRLLKLLGEDVPNFDYYSKG